MLQPVMAPSRQPTPPAGNSRRSRQAVRMPPPSVNPPRVPVASNAWVGNPDPAAHFPSRQTDPASLCEAAVTTAEFAARLPPRLLGAISVTETARFDPVKGRNRPWPWTINAEGEGQFFATARQAIDAVKALQQRGVRSIDVGCMQVNLLYHPNAFASLEAAFDPQTNAAYAARFLNALYAASTDWPAAIAAYHSETPALGDAYRVLVMARWQNGDPHPTIAEHVAYADFAQSDHAYGSRPDGSGASGSPAYAEQADSRAYGAFAPRSRVYGAFPSH